MRRLNNITDEKRSSLTHDAEIVSPLAHPPISLDIFAENFLAVIEEILDPHWGLRKIHHGVTHLPSKVAMVARLVRNIEKFHLGYKFIKLLHVLGSSLIILPDPPRRPTNSCRHSVSVSALSEAIRWPQYAPTTDQFLCGTRGT